MALTLEQIRELVLEGESNHLDFKREQYHFVGLSGPDGDKEKAKLLKDVLAFANAFRKDPAFILVGVDESLPRDQSVAGIPSQDVIDDATLQQFVNSKTNRPIPFRAYTVSCSDSRVVEVLEIDPCANDRPFYLKKGFGGIAADDVWFRSSSSNTKATPEILFRMGCESTRKSPKLVPEVWSPNSLDNEGGVGVLNLQKSSSFSTDPKPIDPVVKLLGEYPDAWFEQIKRALSLIKICLRIKNDKSGCKASNVSGRLWIASSDCNARVITEVARYIGGGIGGRIGSQLSALPSSHDLRPGECIDTLSAIYLLVDHPGSVCVNYQILSDDTPPIELAAIVNVASVSVQVNDKLIKKAMSYAYADHEFLSLIPRVFHKIQGWSASHDKLDARNKEP